MSGPMNFNCDYASRVVVLCGTLKGVYGSKEVEETVIQITFGLRGT